jgi:hypothetical protein
LRDGRNLLECHTRRLQCQVFLTGADILGKTAHRPQDIPEDFIPRLKSRDVLADSFNPPGYVRAKYLAAWSSQAADAGIQRFAYQPFPIRSVQGYRHKLDQHLVVRRGRFLYLFDLQNIR